MNKKSDPWTRRRFLQSAGTTLALAGTAPIDIASEHNTAEKGKKFLREYGFWEYTTPGTGGFEQYDYDDYMLALDDMVKAGMNSLLLQIKWVTTGYRSRLPYLDQLPGNKIIESDNELLRKVIRAARSRKIKLWLSLVTNHFEPDKFGSVPHTIRPNKHNTSIISGLYDPDAPMVVERSAEMFEEILDLFPDVDGLELEMEYVAVRTPHRIPLYNEWAKANSRPLYDDPACVSGFHWFDYQTMGIVKVMRAIEKAVRSKGFKGDLAHINNTGRSVYATETGKKYTAEGAVNIELLHRECPSWSSVDYVYDKGLKDNNHGWFMDLAVNYPKRIGMNAYYLGRGVMTYTWGNNVWNRQRLERSWEQDIFDVLVHQPHGFWWFGAGSKGPGAHTSLPILKQMGYSDDVAARRTLLKMAEPLRNVII
jgi:hypothetical protein